MSDPVDELVPNCVTCRQHFEDCGLLMAASARLAGEKATDAVARVMRAFHEEHQPHDN